MHWLLTGYHLCIICAYINIVMLAKGVLHLVTDLNRGKVVFVLKIILPEHYIISSPWCILDATCIIIHQTEQFQSKRRISISPQKKKTLQVKRLSSAGRSVAAPSELFLATLRSAQLLLSPEVRSLVRSACKPRHTFFRHGSHAQWRVSVFCLGRRAWDCHEAVG